MTLIISGFTIFFLLVFYRPHWGVYIILAGLPTYQFRFSFLGFPATFLEGLILILALVIIIKMIFSHNYETKQISTSPILETSQNKNQIKFKRFKDIFLKFPHLLILFDLFILAGIISIFVSPETLKALGIFKAYILEGILFWFIFVILIDTKEKFFQSLKSVGFLLGYLAIFGIFQFFTLFGLPPSWWGPGTEPRRVVSFYSYPNAVALLIAPILALFSSLLIFYKNIFPHNDQIKTVKNKDRKKIKQAFFLSKSLIFWINILGVILLILTFSRGAWLGYIASVVLLLFFSQYKKIILAALILGLIMILIIPTTRNRILPIFTGNDPASFERVKLYRGSLEIIKQNPILGAGLYGFRDAYQKIRASEDDEILNYPHNFFLNFWMETGLLGLAAILAILIWTFRFGKKLYAENKKNQPLILAVFAGLIVILVHGQVDVPFFKNDLAILFWFLLALLPAISMFENSSTGETIHNQRL